MVLRTDMYDHVLSVEAMFNTELNNLKWTPILKFVFWRSIWLKSTIKHPPRLF